ERKDPGGDSQSAPAGLEAGQALHRPGHRARPERRARSRDRRDRGAARVGTVDGQALSWKAQTLGEALASRQGEALVTRLGRFTYQQLFERAKGAAGAMQAMGIGRGDHVGILMGNDEKWLSLFFGAALIGAVTVPVNTRLKSDEIRYCIEQADCE